MTGGERSLEGADCVHLAPRGGLLVRTSAATDEGFVGEVLGRWLPAALVCERVPTALVCGRVSGKSHSR